MNRSYTFVDKHRCQLGHYDRSALAGIYVYLQTPRTQQPKTAASYDGPVVTPHPPARRVVAVAAVIAVAAAVVVFATAVVVVVTVVRLVMSF